MFDKTFNIDQNYKIEYFRKGIHFCSLSIPVIYYFVDKTTAISILIPITAVFLISDLLRFYNKNASVLYYKYFGWLLRNHERDEKVKRFTGATNILLSAIFCVLVFPKIITITAFAVLIISDSTSALIGRRFGSIRFLKKSLEGMLGFFLSGAIVILLTPKIEYNITEYIIALVAVGAAAITESALTFIDDNISAPIILGCVMWLLYYLLLPNYNLYLLG